MAFVGEDAGGSLCGGLLRLRDKWLNSFWDVKMDLSELIEHGRQTLAMPLTMKSCWALGARYVTSGKDTAHDPSVAAPSGLGLYRRRANAFWALRASGVSKKKEQKEHEFELEFAEAWYCRRRVQRSIDAHVLSRLLTGLPAFLG